MSRHIVKLLAASVLAALLVLSIPGTATTATSPGPDVPSAAEVEGRGVWEEGLCISCTATIVAASGGTVSGVVEAGSVTPEFIAACARACMNAHAT